MSTITLTYGDVCENHVGMQQIGQLASHGLSSQLLEAIQAKYPENAELIRLHTQPTLPSGLPEASLLIIRNGVNLLMNDSSTTHSSTAHTDPLSALYREQSGLEPDKKAKMRGRVVNKQARYNLCFSSVAQAPDYENGKGTVVSWEQVPWTRALGVKLAETFGTRPLECEGNYYFDAKSPKIGIASHGDSERRTVIGVRLGEPMPLMYWWFQNFQPIGNPISVMLGHGDIYAMSEKAVGFDWKRSSIPTLRHSAGTLAFIENEKKRILKKVAERQTVTPPTVSVAPVVTAPVATAPAQGSDLILERGASDLIIG